MKRFLLMGIVLLMVTPVYGQRRSQSFNEVLGATKAIDTMVVAVPVDYVIGDSILFVVKIDSGVLNRRLWVLEQAPVFKGLQTPDDTVKAYAIVGDTIRTANLQIKGPTYKGNGTHVQYRLRSTAFDSTGYGVGNRSNVKGGIVF